MRGRDQHRRDEIEQEAVRRLIALLDDASPAARAELDAWIGQDPAHGVAFARAEAAWEAADPLKTPRDGAAGERRDPANDAPERDRPAIRTSRRALMLGAAVAAAAVGIPAFLRLRSPAVYETAVGEVRNVPLADGSVLHLNTASRVEVDFRTDRRLLRLIAGEAYFEVAHDPARPFDVAARGVVVRALGTAFNVRLRDAVVELTVTKGVVGVTTAAARGRAVSAGGGAIIQPRTVALATLDQRAVDQRTAWRERMIELDGESVAQAVDEFNRYRSAPVVIGDQRIVPMRIGGRFRTDEAADFIAALEQTLPVRAVNNADGSVLLLYRDEDG